VTRGWRIVGLGDSTTAGTPGFRSPLEAPPSGQGDPRSQYAHWMVQLHPEWQVDNCGIAGEGSGEVLARLDRDVLQRRPDLAVILAGVCDVFRGADPGEIRSNLSTMYARCRAAGIGVLAATILPYATRGPSEDGAIAEVNRWIEEEARATGLLFCDTHGLTRDPRRPTRLSGSPDGLHPDIPAYRRMGEGLARVIEESGPSRTTGPPARK
jgi:lysophospholipase L1-like esterase